MFTLSVPGAVLDARVVTGLEELIRPYSLEYYENWRRQGDVKSEEIIEKGGTVETLEWSITEPSGIVHQSMGSGYTGQPFPIDRLPDYQFASLNIQAPHMGGERTAVSISAGDFGISATVSAEANEIISLCDRVRTLLEEAVDPSRLLGQLPPFRVFIGHGGDRKWEAVRDYIVAAGYEIEAFESVPRAGEMTLAVVELMISRSKVAVMVMTGVDELRDGRKLARQNVVHEIGMAQGLLGVENTIVLLEEGTEEFTNIAGLTQVRFASGEAHTTKDHVLASLANQARKMGYPQT
jgi:hypothetical protein